MLFIVLNSGCAKDDFVETVGVCPIVVSNPENGAINVPLNQIISVTFNEEMNGDYTRIFYSYNYSRSPC
jgi:hypothetical protein